MVILDYKNNYRVFQLEVRLNHMIFFTIMFAVKANKKLLTPIPYQYYILKG